MSSVSDLRAFSIAIAAAAAMLAAGCGDRLPGDLATAGSPPPVFTPVGPVPGPEENPVRPANPYHGTRGATMEGRQLFVRFNCSGCHGGRAGGGMGPSLRDAVWRYGSTDAQIFSTIAEGRDQGMPAWGTKITQDQIWKLVAYVQSLRTPDEPDPPQ
jgi:cytochrome c oxidase cbb3-type subunit 3